MIARDGRVVWFRDEAIIVRGSAGQRLCWQGLMLDITGQREAEESIRRIATSASAPPE